MVLPCKTVHVDVVFPILAGASPRLPRSRVSRDDESMMVGAKGGPRRETLGELGIIILVLVGLWPHVLDYAASITNQFPVNGEV